MKPLSPRQCFALAACLVLVQVTLLCALTQAPWRESWWQLSQWDTGWYRSILERGYQSGFPPAPKADLGDNVAFFPGYPALAAMALLLTRVSATAALLITAHLAAFAFWCYFFLICREWRIPALATLVAAALLFAYYGTYFLGVAYSESLTLSSFAGLFYHTLMMKKGGKGRAFVAALHGIVLSASRLVGAPFCAIPLLYVLCLRLGDRRARILPYLDVSLASLLGLGMFLAFCHFAFGHWNLYFITQLNGWGSEVDPLLPLDPRTYFDPRLYSANGLARFSGEELGHAAATLTALLFLYALYAEIAWYRRHRQVAVIGAENRWPLYATGWASFHAALARAGTSSFSGMYRYALPALVALSLAFLDLYRRRRVAGTKRRFARFGPALLLVASVVSLIVQYQLAVRFLAGAWME